MKRLGKIEIKERVNATGEYDIIRARHVNKSETRTRRPRTHSKGKSVFKDEQKSVFKIWRGVKRGESGVYGDGTDRHQFDDGDVRVFTCEQGCTYIVSRFSMAAKHIVGDNSSIKQC